jgi:hypothetical protein
MKKCLFTLAGAVTLTLCMGVVAMADVPTDYAAYFTFDGSTDGATAVEQGSSGKVGAATTKNFNYVDGKNGKAIAINDTTDEYGDTDNIGLDTNVTLGSSDSYTISFWAKAYDAPFAAPIVWVGSTDQSPENWVSVWAGFNSGEWQSAAGIGSNDSSNGENRVNLVAPLGTLNEFGWEYITLVVDEDRIASIYYNGVFQGSTEEQVPVLRNGSHVYVGANAWDTPADMEIDDLVIFKRALSEKEIQSLYQVNGVPDANAKVVEQEETTTAVKKKVSTAAGGVDYGDGTTGNSTNSSKTQTSSAKVDTSVLKDSITSAALISGIVAVILSGWCFWR